jgi:hypothetical protein
MRAGAFSTSCPGPERPGFSRGEPGKGARWRTRRHGPSPS